MFLFRNEQGRFAFSSLLLTQPLFLTQKKKETRADRAAKFSLGGAAGVTTMCLETHALRGGEVTSAPKHSKKKKKCIVFIRFPLLPRL